MTKSSNELTKSLSAGDVLLGLYHGYPAESILESVAAGWDFVWIDAQHGQFSMERALAAVRATGAMGSQSLLRVPTHDPGLLAQYADTAASALMIPQVNSVERAESVVSALRFPPVGNRSFGGRRPVDVHGRDYYRTHEPLVVVQIESREGLDNLDNIAAVNGVDALFSGMDDIKLSLGFPVETPLNECEALLQVQRAIPDAARRAGKWCGCGIVEPRDAATLAKMGYQMLVIGGDVRFLRVASKQALEEGRRALQQHRLNAN